jgi:hypothetical protein
MLIQAQLAALRSGDTLTPSGPQGDVAFANLKFSPAVTIVGLVCRTLRLYNCQGIHFQAPDIAFTPDMHTVAWTAAVYISGCSDIVLDGGKVIGGPAINGVAETAPAVTASGVGAGNVIGRLCGYGINIVNSSGCNVTGSEIAQFDRGIVLGAVTDCVISGNDVHDRRRTAICGGGLTRVTIDGNIVRSSMPWRWGDTPVGDHADCMAFWSATGQTTPNVGVKITNNLMEQLSGATLLGMWFQGGTDGKSPFTDFEISGNTILVPNLQGIMLVNSKNGIVARNVLIQAVVPGVSPKQCPTILLRANCDGIAIVNNRVGAPISDLSKGANPQSGNVLLAGSVTA